MLLETLRQPVTGLALLGFHQAAWCSTFSCLKIPQIRDSAGFQVSLSKKTKLFANECISLICKHIFIDLDVIRTHTKMLGYREASLSWLPIYEGDKPPPHAVEADKEIYVIRARHQDDVLPGKWPLHIGHIAHLPFHDLEVEVTTFEVLCDTGLYSGKS
ncbi:hypothetical protein CSKR_100230, partial [Clonorchis sinensis]